MLSIWLEICRTAGIDEVLINIHRHGDLVRSFLAAHPAGIKVTISDEPQLLGSAGTLRANRQWVSSETEFWIFYADVLTDGNLLPMMDIHRKRKPVSTLGVYRVPDPSRCGIVETRDDGIIEAFVEKPVEPKGNLAFAGIMIGSPALLDVIPHGKSDIGFDILPRLTGRILAYPLPSYVLDIGTIENYERAQLAWPGLI